MMGEQASVVLPFPTPWPFPALPYSMEKIPPPPCTCRNFLCITTLLSRVLTAVLGCHPRQACQDDPTGNEVKFRMTGSRAVSIAHATWRSEVLSMFAQGRGHSNQRTHLV